MKKPNIIITSPDHVRLRKMIALRNPSERERDATHSLAEELERAEVVASHLVPPDVITMNSRAELLDLDTGERMAFTLVFPDEADVSESKISVLAPVGAGMLGYRIGDTFERTTPFGVRRLQVVDVTFQPESSMVHAA